MTTLTVDLWERLRRFANGIELDSLSIGPARFRFGQSTEHPPAFAQIRERLAVFAGRPVDVFAVSAHNLDEVTVVDRIDADHECEALNEPLRVAGGAAANTAFVLAMLGTRVRISGVVGDDVDGQMLLDELTAAGADVRPIVKSRLLPTGKTVILVERGGRRLIVVHPGINNRFAALSDENSLLEEAVSSKVVHLSSFVGVEELHLQQRLVTRIGAQSLISLTPGALYARQGLDRLEGLLRYVDVIFAYKEHLADLVANSSAATFLRGQRTADLLEALFAWRSKNGVSSPVVVVVKDPTERSPGTVRERYLSVGVGTTALERYVAPQSLPRGAEVRSVDTTGAGDAAAAGFLFGLLNGAELEVCIDIAFLLAAFGSTEVGSREAFAARRHNPVLADALKAIETARPGPSDGSTQP